MTKNAKRTKAIFGGLVAITIVLGQFVMPALTNAGNDPTFNMFSPYVRTQTQGRDYFLINVKNETQGGDWTGNVNAKAGDTLLFYIFYHNGENNTVARNTRIKIDAPLSNSSSQHTVSASLWADNATNATAANPFRQSAQIGLNDSQKLEFVPGSVKWFPNQTDWKTASPVSLPGNQPENILFTSGINIGDIEGCWEFSGAIMFRLKVGQQQQNDVRDLSISKTVRNITTGGDYSDSTNAKNGDHLSYQVKVTNTGNASLNNVIARDSLMANLNFVSGSIRIDGAQCWDNLSSINLGSLAVGASKTITYEVMVSYAGSNSITITNTAYAKADYVNEKNDSAFVYVSGQVQPNLSLNINKTVRNITSNQGGDSDSANAKINDRLLYKISVFNNGNATLTNVIVRDNLPSQLSIVSGTLRVDNDINYGNLSSGINIGSINIGVSKIVSFEATVNSPGYNFNSFTITNTSFARADNVPEKSDSATVYVSQDTPQNKDLSINKTVRNVTSWQGDYSDFANANNNDRLSYRIQVTNTGNAALNNVIVRDTLPSQISFVSGSIRIDGAQCWDNLSSINLGSLAVGASKTITYEAIVSHSGSNSVTAINTAFAKADNVNEKSDSATVYIAGQVQPNLNLSISKTVRNVTQNTSYFSSVNANPNDRVAFRIEINSSGSNQSVNNVRVWDILPSGLNFVSGSARLDNSFLSDQIVSGGVNLGSIGPNQTRVITFEANVNWWGWGSNTWTNTAYVSGDNVPQRSASAQVIVSQNPTPTPTFTPTPTPTFSPAPNPCALTKKVENLTSPNGTDFANMASVGDTLRYRISYTNFTNSYINNVQILDVIPSHASFVSVAESTGSFDSSKNMITWSAGSLAPGAAISVSYQAKVASSVPHDEFVIVNTAAIRANEIPLTDSNEVRTTVRLSKTPIKAVTGSNSQTTALIFSIIGTLWALFIAYLAMEYKQELLDLRLKWAIYRIKRS